MPDTSTEGLKYDYDLPDAKEADRLMDCAFEYYLKHYQVVQKKIVHARTATQQSMEEYEHTQGNSKDSKEFQDMEKCDSLWHMITELFKNAGVAEDDLTKIESILLTIPRTIKQYYDTLIEQDKPLLLLVKELAAEKYKKACEIIENIQKRPNEMSGLDSKEYDAAEDTQAYILKSPLSRRS